MLSHLRMRSLMLDKYDKIPCKNCGNWIYEDSIECVYCGEMLVIEADVIAPEEAEKEG